MACERDRGGSRRRRASRGSAPDGGDAAAGGLRSRRRRGAGSRLDARRYQSAPAARDRFRPDVGAHPPGTGSRTAGRPGRRQGRDNTAHGVCRGDSAWRARRGRARSPRGVPDDPRRRAGRRHRHRAGRRPQRRARAADRSCGLTAGGLAEEPADFPRRAGNRCARWSDRLLDADACARGPGQ